MSSMSRDHGFLAALGSLRARELFYTSEFLLGVPLGVLLALGQTFWGSTDLRVATSALFVSVITAMMGVVFAGFALAVAFLSAKFMSFLNGSPGGIKTFFRPFIISLGMQCILLFLAIFHTSLGMKMQHHTELILFYAASIIFSWVIVDIVALAKSVMMQATVKAELDRITGESDSN